MRSYTQKQTCPICGHNGWCMYAGTIENPDRVLCARRSDGCATNRFGEKLGSKDGVYHLYFLTPYTGSPVRAAPVDREDGFRAECPPPVWASRTARSFELPEGVDRKGFWAIGGMVGRSGICAPMKDEFGIAVGWRIRYNDGRKRSVPGGCNAMFYPDAIFETRPHSVVICEGMTDTCVLASCGISVIGRPSNNGCRAMIMSMVTCLRPACVYIVPDEDVKPETAKMTFAAAVSLFDCISTVCPVDIIKVQDGCKDIREMQQRGVLGEWLRHCGIVDREMSAA